MMQIASQLHDLINSLSGWTVFLLVLGGLVSILIFFKVFESDFNTPD